MSTFAIAQLVMGIITQGIKIVTQLRETAKKTGEWTTDQEKEFDNNLEVVLAGGNPVWTVEPDPDNELPMT